MSLVEFAIVNIFLGPGSPNDKGCDDTIDYSVQTTVRIIQFIEDGEHNTMLSTSALYVASEDDTMRIL